LNSSIECDRTLLVVYFAPWLLLLWVPWYMPPCVS
jgi:hypothetical protein